MRGRFGRTLFALGALVRSPLMSATSMSATGTGEALPGVRGRLYESPHAGWTLVFEQDRWAPESATSGNGIDTLTLMSRSPETSSAKVMFRTSPGTVADLASSLEATEAEIQAIYPTSTVTRAAIDGVDPSGMWYEDHFVASCLVTGDDAPGGSATVDVDCWPISGTQYVLTVTAMSSPAEYEAAFALADRLRSAFRPAGVGRSQPVQSKEAASAGGASAGGASGVVEFRQISEGSGYLGLTPEDVEALDVEYLPPQMEIPPGKAPVLFTGLVGNVDILPALVDLRRFVARFPAGEHVPGDHVFTPVAHQWLLGFPPDTGPEVTLQPGQGAAYLLWFVVDIVAENESLSIDAKYEPGDGTATIVGRSSSRGYYYPIAGGGAGGGRPKVQY